MTLPREIWVSADEKSVTPNKWEEDDVRYVKATEIAKELQRILFSEERPPKKLLKIGLLAEQLDGEKVKQ